MNLFIDLGNTRLKWATGGKADDLTPGETIDNFRLTSATLVELWRSIGIPEKIAVARVGDSRFWQMIITAVKELWPNRELISAKSETHALGVTNAYPAPEKLGVDRWLSMIAAYHKLQQSFCVVSCGTAITLDLVNHEGEHLGGLICPGLRLMRESLAANTANLNLKLDTYPFGLADNTEAAIYNGSLTATCGLIEMSLKNRPPRIPLLLTGGDAETIAGVFSRPVIIEPHLVLEGLALRY